MSRVAWAFLPMDVCTHKLDAQRRTLSDPRRDAMAELLPVQPLPIEYAGCGAALGPPIRHEGMELPTPPGEMRRLIGEALLGGFCAASLIIALAAISELAFPADSHLRLLRPVLPIVGMFIAGAIANRLSRAVDRCGWPVGLWLGGWLPFGLYGMYLMAIGYGEWVRVLF